ncbi:hypothetical protein F5B22DRAFT_632285 [Xylaria bambusicola]|uniref:uncharacterized protein n=1 Tax=Xylaria bambusicola TaxID=326684 RepID=UPI002008D530|nr:uncharacterized protein F5B22DRAFT_632285 [Xylaria bambusicola]KAI0502724.1 hypothetical protein F5B22DRAFT_632285 [Xylaria bambusicola]
MSATDGFDALDNILFTECRCHKKAPYLLMIPLDQNGDPAWNHPQHIYRAAICRELQCGFFSPLRNCENEIPMAEKYKHWESQYALYQSQAMQQENLRSISRSQIEDARIEGNGSRIGNDLINLSFNFLQNHSIPTSAPINPSFWTLVENSTELSMLLNPSFDTILGNSGRLEQQRRWILFAKLMLGM